jgi:hypothetical protein
MAATLPKWGCKAAVMKGPVKNPEILTILF